MKDIIEKSKERLNALIEEKLNALEKSNALIAKSDKERRKAEVFGRTCDRFIIDDPINLNYKEGDKEIMNIIEKSRYKQLEAINNETQKASETFLKSTRSGKIMVEAIKKLNEQESVEVKFEDVFKEYMLTDEDTKALNEILEKFKDKYDAVIAKFEELEFLYKEAETFEQQRQLLSEYGILKYGKKEK